MFQLEKISRFRTPLSNSVGTSEKILYYKIEVPKQAVTRCQVSIRRQYTYQADPSLLGMLALVTPFLVLTCGLLHFWIYDEFLPGNQRINGLDTVTFRADRP